MKDRTSRSAIDGDEALRTGSTSTSAKANKLLLLEETAEVSKQAVVTGTVRVSTHTETRQDVAEVVLDRNVVDVTRVPVGRVVDVAPAVRTVEDTTIVPVVQERFVIVKQLFLLEEIHIRHHVERETASVPVELRRQVAVVERVDPLGHVTIVSESNPESPDQGTNRGESHGHS
ncbi:YsnF/AvaK domain-containing protein [Lichenihabitans sp. Uapishka_5]|uniref:YsnF/AvaK domain-containing protein n=1 Tax=Lichenihabitans sp. Uapishka_5 TaxID=3037302 RepID=UPI0029E7EC86|nr:YsnF/AvaK domain-containing protein [Lichenihabitans sp. Uapishka_5]MDX7951364.1 YsnF/AvaK domain-containing protein [Lichenihabitans sp. Uapishka_5]